MYVLDIVQRVYSRLRKPSQQSLPYQRVVEKVRDAIARKRLDLALSEQNHVAEMSDWFVPSESNFPLQNLGLDAVLPIRVEVRGGDSEYETGDNVPIVNYEVLDTSIVGAVSFYGDPIRMAFRDTVGHVSSRQYRLLYEPDFYEQVKLESVVGLPNYFGDMVVIEAAWGLLGEIEDTTKEWLDYRKFVFEQWKSEIVDYRVIWDKYVRLFKGRAQVPKRTFWQNQLPRVRTRYFKD